MKKFKDYKDEIYSCSRCGLCQGICPVYQATGLETAVSRGQFTLLNGIVNGELCFNEKVYQNLNKCLHCNACKSYCPSDIDAEKIITAAKAECFAHASLLKKFILKVLNSDLMLRTFGFGIEMLRFSRVLNILNFKFAKFIRGFIKEKIKYKQVWEMRNLGLKVVYFPGCVNSYFNRSILNAVRITARKNGIELIVPGEFKCCAIAHLSAGDVESFRQNALHNLELIPDDVDYVLFDCASCQRAFGLYDELFGSKRTKELRKKFVHINNFLAEHEIYIPENVEFNKVVNEHIPCHLSDKESIRKVAAKMPFIKDFNADETGLCCGAAGLFCVENSKISLEISNKKASILAQNADIVMTSCASCTMGLLQGFASLGKNVEIYNPVELLAEKYLLEEESFM